MTGAIRSQPSIEETGAVGYCEGEMEKLKTGGLRRHGMLYSLDTGRLMGDPLLILIDHGAETEYFYCGILSW